MHLNMCMYIYLYIYLYVLYIHISMNHPISASTDPPFVPTPGFQQCFALELWNHPTPGQALGTTYDHGAVHRWTLVRSRGSRGSGPPLGLLRLRTLGEDAEDKLGRLKDDWMLGVLIALGEVLRPNFFSFFSSWSRSGSKTSQTQPIKNQPSYQLFHLLGGAKEQNSPKFAEVNGLT